MSISLVAIDPQYAAIIVLYVLCTTLGIDITTINPLSITIVAIKPVRVTMVAVNIHRYLHNAYSRSRSC